MLSHPTYQSTTIAAINPKQAKLFAPSTQPLKDETRAITFLHRGGGNDDQQQQPQRVNQQVALAPLDMFGCIVAANAFDFSGLNALAIQTTGGRMLVASGLLTHLSAQCVMQALPVATQAPLAEIMIDALPTRIFTWQHPPLDAANDDIEDGVNDHSHVQRARASARFRKRNQLFDKIPLAVSQIGWVDLVRHTQNLLDRAGWQSTSQTASKAPKYSYRVLCFRARWVGLCK